MTIYFPALYFIAGSLLLVAVHLVFARRRRRLKTLLGTLAGLFTFAAILLVWSNTYTRYDFPTPRIFPVDRHSITLLLGTIVSYALALCVSCQRPFMDHRRDTDSNRKDE